MTDVSSRNFGYLIAYVIPGFVIVLALAQRFDAVRAWVGVGETAGPTVGGFLYVTLASVATGMLVSAVRWLILDAIHHRTGVTPPARDFTRLQRQRRSFYLLVEFHFRYYEFFGHMLIATLAWIPLAGGFELLGSGQLMRVGIGLALLAVLLFVASRDALRKYYERSRVILG